MPWSNLPDRSSGRSRGPFIFKGSCKACRSVAPKVPNVKTQEVHGMSDDWWVVGRYENWNQADAVRTATMNDTPTLDVRVLSNWGEYVVEVKRP
jgi:hypothetical protein